jgi:hypothetical protein
MKFTVLGSNQRKAVEFGLDLKDLVIIEWMQKFWPKMKKKIIDGKEYGWVKYDALIDYAKTLTSTKNKPMKVALRLIVSKDDSIQYDLDNPNNNNGWYGLSNSAKDQFGYPIRVGNGYGHVSLSYPAGVAQVYDFVTKTLLLRDI